MKRLIPRAWLVRILVWTYVDRLKRAELALEDEQVIKLRTAHALPSTRFRQLQRLARAAQKFSRLQAEMRELPEDVQEQITDALKARQ